MNTLNCKSILIILVKISFLIGAFTWIFSKIDIQSLKHYILNASITWLFIAYIMLHISLFFSALRSRFYFSTFGSLFTRTFTAALYYVGTAFNVILPGGIGGDGYRVYLLWKLEKFPKLTSLLIILYERINGLYLLIVLALFLLPLSSFISLIPYGNLITLVLLIVLLILVTPCYFIGARYIFKDKIPTMLKAANYSFIVQFFQIIFAFCLTKAILPNPGFTDYIDFAVLFSVASMVTIIPISIGGAGLRELTFLYGAEFLGTAAESGIAFAMMSFVLYVLTALWGVPLFFYIKEIKRRCYGSLTNPKNK